MKTLKYAWLGLLIVVVILVLGLKKFPEVISYDYYYRYLNVYATLKTDKAMDAKEAQALLEKLEKDIKTGIKYPLNEEYKKDSKYTIEQDSVSLAMHLKFKNFHDCYMYLLHHRNADMKILADTEISKENFVRKTKITYVKQSGAYSQTEGGEATANDDKGDNQKAKESPSPVVNGEIEISAVCRF